MCVEPPISNKISVMSTPSALQTMHDQMIQLHLYALSSAAAVQLTPLGMGFTYLVLFLVSWKL